MLHHLFEEIVDLYKENIAISYKSETMSYNQLNINSNKLACELIEKGVSSGEHIALLMERSLEMIVAIWAVLKAGGTYVPIDPDYPDGMIEYIIEDSKPKLILTNIEEKLSDTIRCNDNVIYVSIDKKNEKYIKPPNICLPDDALAYTIYTSGSTGTPKGVMVEHRSLINMINAFNMKLASSNADFTPLDVWTQFFSIGFDFSVWEIFGALLTGATLVIVPNEMRKNIKEYRRFLVQNKITVINQTPSIFYALQAEELKHLSEQLSVTTIIFGGEKLNPALLKGWKNKYKNVNMLNIYGITETAVNTAYKEINEEDMSANICNMGKALPHLSIHIIDENLKVVMGRAIGEIIVEGTGLARGYINNPGLTKEKFIRIPAISKNILYRTGDLGRYLPDGDIEYIGRVDNQIKIRGHRIELEGIESHINQFKGIKQSVVVVLETNETDKILKALYTSEYDIDDKEIIDYLLVKLPPYMVPSVYERVDNIICTMNGKIDRKKMLELASIKNYYKLLANPGGGGADDIRKRAFDVILSNINPALIRNVSLDTSLVAAGLDSLNFIKTIISLESEFNFTYDDDMHSILKYPDIRKMIDYVESKVTNKSLVEVSIE